MKTKKVLLLASVLVLVRLIGYAQLETEAQNNDLDLFNMSMEELLNIEVYDEQFKLYGFINSNVEKVMNVPARDTEGNTITASDPVSWSPVQNFHIYGSGNITKNIMVFFNLARTDRDGLEVRNAYGNFRLTELFQIRAGKMYRRFGLYNEKLDQIPTFIGIESPELFDNDHLFLERTTNFMVHGAYDFLNGKASYALSTDNGEGGPSRGVAPLGWDVRYQSDRKGLLVGTSGYSSSINGNMATSTVNLGEGSPDGGILPWMQGDNFTVYGVFVEKQYRQLILQSAYWVASHQAVRDPLSVLTLIQDAGINTRQRETFLGTSSTQPDVNLSENDVITKAKYTAQTFYVRLGYSIKSKVGQFIPYVFMDWMSNPEVIQNKTYGGDNESGLSDDGQFYKSSVGVVYRPVKSVAVKLDGSTHTQQFNGTSLTYPEIRMDFSFSFDALSSLYKK